MLANLITTILLALGVATGSYQSESGNAFNNEEEIKESKPIQQAVQTNNYNLSWTNEATYDNTQTKYWSYKQYLMVGSNSNTENQGVNIILDPFLITNTAYTMSANLDGRRRTYNYIILKFTNYTNSVQKLTLTASATYQNTNNIIQQKQVYTSNDDTLNELIDLTLNASTLQTVQNIYNNANKTQIYTDTRPLYNVNNLQVITESPQITLEETETKYVLIYNYLDAPESENYGWIYNNNLQINGTYIQKEITTEIIDVPNLMFTILTMPFAWYSTAFNLTIFPNTPYALNFGNLILTIIAAMTLLYLIRKILK